MSDTPKTEDIVRSGMAAMKAHGLNTYQVYDACAALVRKLAENGLQLEVGLTAARAENEALRAEVEGLRVDAEIAKEEITNWTNGYGLLFKENGELRDLIHLIFSSTLPYNDENPTFSDDVVANWKKLSPDYASKLLDTAAAMLIIGQIGDRK